MPRVLEEQSVAEHPGLETVDDDISEAEVAEEMARFRGRPDAVADLSDGGQVGGVTVFPVEDGKRMTQGRPSTRAAWRWDGTPTLLPLAYDPSGKTHDGARRYLLKRYCMCCQESGFRRRCPRCVKNNCHDCSASTVKGKVIPCYYLNKEKVPFQAKFYGSVDCFLPETQCIRHGGRGFKTEEDMRFHARVKHKLEYSSFLEAEAMRRSRRDDSEKDDLRQRLRELETLVRGQQNGGSAPATRTQELVAAVGTPDRPLYVSDKVKKPPRK